MREISFQMWNRYVHNKISGYMCDDIIWKVGSCWCDQLPMLRIGYCCILMFQSLSSSHTTPHTPHTTPHSSSHHTPHPTWSPQHHTPHLLTSHTQVEEGWYEGLLNGKRGMFPENFVHFRPVSSILKGRE